METLLYLSLAINVMLSVFVVYRHFKTTPKINQETLSQPAPEQPRPTPTKQPQIINQHLHDLAIECEAKLPDTHRGLIKILVEKDYPELAAALQIKDIRINLKRDEHPQSLFSVNSPRDALYIARDGHNDTGRYIPVPSEVELILKYQEPINVYLRALGLETISSEDRFWCVDTATGWITGWKRFRWDVTTALNALNNQFRIRTPNGYIALPYYPDTAKLFVLLKGWEHLFAEV